MINLSRAKSTLILLVSCAVYALVVALPTLAVILVFTQEVERILLYLSHALLVEGGLALVTGGVVASFSPAIGRVSAGIFNKKPWDAKRLKAAEGDARVWIVTGTFLFLMGFLVSAF